MSRRPTVTSLDVRLERATVRLRVNTRLRAVPREQPYLGFRQMGETSERERLEELVKRNVYGFGNQKSLLDWLAAADAALAGSPSLKDVVGEEGKA